MAFFSELCADFGRFDKNVAPVTAIKVFSIAFLRETFIVVVFKMNKKGDKNPGRISTGI